MYSNKIYALKFPCKPTCETTYTATIIIGLYFTLAKSKRAISQYGNKYLKCKTRLRCAFEFRNVFNDMDQKFNSYICISLHQTFEYEKFLILINAQTSTYNITKLKFKSLKA